jgi:phage gpG-like protein
MAGVTVQVDERAVQVSLGDLRAAVTDYPALLRIAGNLMRASVARTFRDEGSPAGSWPRLALSTLKNKRYTAGHKLLILSGRLFGSITYLVAGNLLTIGTNVVYAAVQNFGSADRSGGSIGAQAKIAGRGVKVSAHDALRVVPFRKYGNDLRMGKDGKGHSVRVRAQGPDAATRYGVKAHTRHQNIPARRFLVFRPEDPSNIASGMEAYLRGRSVATGGAL